MLVEKTAKKLPQQSAVVGSHVAASDQGQNSSSSKHLSAACSSLGTGQQPEASAPTMTDSIICSKGIFSPTKYKICTPDAHLISQATAGCNLSGKSIPESDRSPHLLAIWPRPWLKLMAGATQSRLDMILIASPLSLGKHRQYGQRQVETLCSVPAGCRPCYAA